MDVSSIIVDNTTSSKLALDSNVLSFDSVVNVRENFTNNITSHPTENNNSITDHVFQRNPTFSFKAVITNASKIVTNEIVEANSVNANSKNELEDWLFYLQQNENDLGVLGSIVPAFGNSRSVADTINELRRRISTFNSDYERYGVQPYGDPEVLDNIYTGGEPTPTNILNRSGTNVRVQKGYLLLKDIYTKKTPIQLLLKNQIYTNCILKSLTFERSSRNSDILEFDVMFEQVRIAGSPEEVTISDVTLDDIARETATQKVAKTSEIAPRSRNQRYVQRFEDQGRLQVPQIRPNG